MAISRTCRRLDQVLISRIPDCRCRTSPEFSRLEESQVEISFSPLVFCAATVVYKWLVASMDASECPFIQALREMSSGVYGCVVCENACVAINIAKTACYGHVAPPISQCLFHNSARQRLRGERWSAYPEDRILSMQCLHSLIR